MKPDEAGPQDRIEILIYGGAVLGFIVLYFLNLLVSHFNHDEFEAVHTAWKIMNGQVIYQDFFQHHHPLLYYCLAPLFIFFQESTHTLFVMRGAMFLCFVSILGITYALSAELYGSKKTGLLSVLFLCSLVIFYGTVLEIRPDVPQALFSLASIYFLIRSSRTDALWPILLSAGCLAISFLFLQKAVFCIFAIFVVQIYRFQQKKISLKTIGLYWIFFICTLSPGILYLWYTGLFKDYFLWNWLLNMKFSNSFLPLRIFAETYKKNGVVWLFFILGILPAFQNKKEREAAILTTLLIFSLFLVKTPYQQYFLPFLPLIAILSAQGITTALSPKKAFISVLIFIILLPMFFYIKEVKHNGNAAQLAKINYVMDNTNKESHVYDGNILFNLFRKDIDYFWYSVRPRTGGLASYQQINPAYTYDIYTQIKKLKPDLISTNYIDDITHPSISKNYTQSPVYSDIYLRNAIKN